MPLFRTFRYPFAASMLLAGGLLLVSCGGSSGSSGGGPAGVTYTEAEQQDFEVRVEENREQLEGMIELLQGFGTIDFEALAQEPLGAIEAPEIDTSSIYMATLEDYNDFIDGDYGGSNDLLLALDCFRSCQGAEGYDWARGRSLAYWGARFDEFANNPPRLVVYSSEQTQSPNIHENLEYDTGVIQVEMAVIDFATMQLIGHQNLRVENSREVFYTVNQGDNEHAVYLIALQRDLQQQVDERVRETAAEAYAGK